MMKVVKISKADWASISEQAHQICFRKLKPAAYDRIDYALLVEGPQEAPIAYVTVRELDPETVYWQFGGAFPPAEGTALVARAYRAMLDFQRAFAKRMTTCVENTNTRMLRMALAHGLLIVGARTVDGVTLVEFIKDL